MGDRKHFLKGSQGRARHHSVLIDGSEVTTTASATGLDEGSDVFTVSKGTGGTSNEVTLTPKNAFLRIPVVVASPITADCKVRVKSQSATSIVLQTVENDDETTGVDDADINVMIDGWDSADAIK